MRPAWLVGVAAVLVACAIAVIVLLPSGHGGPKPRHATSSRVAQSVRRCAYTSESISGLSQFARLTGTAPSCAEVFNEPASTWRSWARPWFLSPSSSDNAWAAWVRAGSGRQLTIAEALIPAAAKGQDWLKRGSEGAYASHARQLARNLVAAGLGHVIIRLGPESNGTWEADSLPSTPSGRVQWRTFWARTVQAMRSVPGAGFRFDWTVNALERPIDLRSFYPGNDVVDIIGIDAYEFRASATAWAQLVHGTDGLDDVAAFARAHGKPLSLPEWGIVDGPSAATLQYFQGLARFVKDNRFAYESYFFAHDYRSALAGGSRGLQAFRSEFAARDPRTRG